MAIKKFNANSVSGGLVSGATVSSSAPSAPSNGALWLNSSTGALLTYYDSGSNTQWLQPVSPTGAVGATGAAGAAGEAGVSVVISSIVLTDSSYATITDTSLSLTGGYIRILGTGFVSGCTVVIDNSVATSVTFVNSAEIRAQLPAKVAGTYILYVSNPSGAVAIRVNAITFSATPSWVTTSPLSGSINVPVSIQLSVASDSTVSYVLQAGSTLPTGLTLSSSGLLSGTVTGITLLTTYNFTIVATDLEYQTSPKAFSITISVSEPYFNSTVLLLQGDVTPFTADASTNTFEISPVGTPSANVNNPSQPGYYSGKFDGSGYYLSVPTNAVFNFGAGAYTVEMWIYPTATTIGNVTNLFQMGTHVGGGNFLELTVENTAGVNTLIGNLYNSSAYKAQPRSTTISNYLNTWHHAALIFTGTTYYVSWDGILSTGVAYSGSDAPTGQTVYIGAWNASTPYFTGYMSNLRVVKGVAVYTGAFTPPTAPLAATQSSSGNIVAITGTSTSLLALQSNRFIDNSSTPKTITAYGTTSISVAQPFTLPSPYTGYGSGLFNGTTDYLSVANNASLQLTGDFTIEFWVYISAIASNNVYISKWNVSSQGYIIFYNSVDSKIIFVNTAITLTPPSTLSLGAWHHIAATRNGNAYAFYIDGASVATGTSATTATDSGTALEIGRNSSNSNNYSNGYLSNLRITKGTAVYTGAFTPPTLAPLTNAGATSAAAYPSTTNVDITFASSATSLLTLQTNQAQNNNQFRDSSTNNFAVTRTGTPTQGTFTPFSQTGWSGYFDGTTDCIQVPAGVAFAPGTGDFTVEGWFFPTNTMIPNYPTTLSGMLFNQAVGGTNYFTIEAGGGKIYFTATSSGGGTAIANGSTSWAVGSWNHFAVVRISGMVTVYLNGIGGTATSNTTDLSNTSYVPTIGRYTHATQSYFFGYISNLRYVKGIGVYTGAFTPPTTALQATQSSGTNITAITGTATSLLTLQNNRFKDNAVTPSTITVGAGTPSIQAFSPLAPSAAYSATTGGGSIYFPGSSNLLVPSNASLALGTVDFTIEMWVYNTSTTNRLISYATSNSPIIYINSSNYVQYDNYGVGGVLTSSILTPLNTWNHIAIVRLSATSKIYINGVQGASGSDTNNWGQSGIYIGVDVATTFMTGYMSSLRIVKGTAVYTGAFTPPTSPLTAIANTVLLLNATNSGIFDATGKNDLITVGDARVSTSVTKYGSGAMYFDGTGDYLNCGYSPQFEFGTGDFTVECWVYTRSYATAQSLFESRVQADVVEANRLLLSILVTSGYPQLYNASNDVAVISTIAIPLNTWTHVAFTRNSGTASVFVNGQVGATNASFTTNFLVNKLVIGAMIQAAGGGVYNRNFINGYIDDYRITKGVARYTTTFTPPASAALKQ